MFAAIYIPDFQLQAALRLEPELHAQAVALIDAQLPKPTVFQLTQSARAAGVCEGLTPTQAMARCREVLIKPRSLAQEQSVQESLLQCAYCFSPNIEATADGICTMDLQGLPNVLPASRRQNGPAATAESNVIQTNPPNSADETSAAHWAERILSALGQLNLQAQIGMAETPTFALHAAKVAEPFLFVENSTAFMSRLPMANLNPPGEILEVLDKWGIRRVGDFLALGKDKIAERLGAEAVELFDLACATTIRPLNLVTPAATFEESMDFENPIESLEPLMFVMRRFIDQLSRRLEVVYFVAEELHLHLGLTSGAKYERTFRIPAPTREVETLFRMFYTHLENVRTDAPISSLRLSAKPCRAGNYQFGLFEVALRDPNQFHETLARLSALLGSDRVGTPVREQSHRPDAFGMDTPRFDASDEFEILNAKPEMPMGPALRRFRPPLPAIVEIRENKPALLRSTPFTGPITDAQGPWRNSGHWWEQEKLWNRDEWDVQTGSGALFRIFQENEQWFVEGTYD